VREGRALFGFWWGCLVGEVEVEVEDKHVWRGCFGGDVENARFCIDGIGKGFAGRCKIDAWLRIYKSVESVSGYSVLTKVSLL
jgi:hypothetical protein